MRLRRPDSRIRGNLGHPAFVALAALFVLLFSAGCGNMRDGAHLKPYEESKFFADGQSSRPLPEGTIARGHLGLGPLNSGSDENNQPVASNPLPVTRELLNTGRERYNITCALCHGRDGYGQGIIVQRGFVKPPSFHEERLRKAADGHFFHVMTSGYGAMYPQVERLSIEERWAIVHYIRALQLSQNATPKDVPPAENEKLAANEEGAK